MFNRSSNRRSNWNLEMLVFEEGGKPEYPHMTPSPEIEPGPHWWEASALTTAPSLLPLHEQLIAQPRCIFILWNTSNLLLLSQEGGN